MHLHWLKRAVAALVLAWFAVVTTEPAALHRCPVHGGGVAAPAPADHHASGHSHPQQLPGDEHSTCTCVGDCSAGGASAALSSAEQRFTPAPPQTSGRPSIETELPRIPAPAFFLPYANGPPDPLVLA
jgi:hypothetical protein